MAGRHVALEPGMAGGRADWLIWQAEGLKGGHVRAVPALPQGRFPATVKRSLILARAATAGNLKLFTSPAVDNSAKGAAMKGAWAVTHCLKKHMQLANCFAHVAGALPCVQRRRWPVRIRGLAWQATPAMVRLWPISSAGTQLYMEQYRAWRREKEELERVTYE